MKRNSTKLTLVIGGARSGKSSYALKLAQRRFSAPLYLATGEARDEEMARRIALHRAARGRKWLCREEPVDVAGALRDLPPRCDGILLDCLTLWLSNILIKEGEKAYPTRARRLISALKACARPVIVVTNEVGLGIVPEHPLGRTFRDLAGWLNQDVAAAADTVVLTVAGLPVALKGDLPE